MSGNAGGNGARGAPHRARVESDNVRRFPLNTKKIPRTKGFRLGLAMRKKVLGEDYVDKALNDTDGFSMPFQELSSEMAWGRVWTRPGLSLRDRSLITVAQCIALNRANEVKIHVRGAVRNGITRRELQELCLHSFLYCGGPAALDAFHIVEAALPEIEALEKAAKAKRDKLNPRDGARK